MKYIQATNTGKGFITHEDRGIGHMSGHPADIYAVSDAHDYWVTRVNGVEFTKVEAEALCLTESQTAWDSNNVEGETEVEKVARIGERPTEFTLPE